MRCAPSYGVRGHRTVADVGVRHTARTYGKARIGTYTEKADGHITLDSETERLVSHVLSVDPRVRSFKPQPFTVDLLSEKLLFTREEVSAARKVRGNRAGSFEYTPDFATVQIDGLQHAYEVKLQGYEGDAAYWEKIERARQIMTAYCFPLFTLVVPTDERHPVLVNVQLLKPALSRAKDYLTAEIVDRVELYCDTGPVTQRELCAELQISPNIIPLLLAKGALQADVAHYPITGMLELCAGYGDLSHLFLIEELTL